MSEGTVATIVIAAASAIVWAVRVEGMVRSHEREIGQLRIDMNSKIDQLLAEVLYIRQRFDEQFKAGRRP
jgi:hypothetical protein